MFVAEGYRSASVQTTREKWVDALQDLNSRDVSNHRGGTVPVLAALFEEREVGKHVLKELFGLSELV
jgi:hypothetical protein